VDNIKKDLSEMGWAGVNWIGLALVESSCEFGIEPSGFIKCWEVLEWQRYWWLLE
jgi:hypothetical protein